MSKLDLTIINNLKLECKNENNVNLDIINIFYELYKNELVYNPDDFNFINKDKVIVSSSLVNIYTKVAEIFYKKQANVYEYAKNSDIFSTSLGLAIGDRYIDSLIKIEIPKCNILTNKVFCICKYDELLSENAFDSILYVNNERLNKMTYIVIKDNYDTCKEDLVDRFAFLHFNIEEINGISKLGNVLADARSSKLPTIVFVTLKNNKELPTIKEEVNYNELYSIVLKRLNKYLVRYQDNIKEYLKDLKIKEIVSFLINKKVKINFKAENIKLNDNYEERLIQSNQKIFNILASKNAFVLNLSDTKDINFINKADIMSKTNKTARNIILPFRINLLSGIANGLSYMGFKIFINTYLYNLPKVFNSINSSSENNLNVHYTFLEDKDNINLIDTLNFIPNLLTFRPCDINEVIGVYEVLKEYNKTTVTIVSLEKVKELKGTNFKYVQAGCYPVKKESDTINGIIIASGYNVSKALNVASALASLGIVLRVLSMPALKVYDMQPEKYKKALMPLTKIFILDQNNNANYKMFVKNNDYIINDEQEEAIKARIIELMKK